MGQNIVELVKIGEAIEDGLNTGKIVSRAVQAGSPRFSRKKKEDVSVVSGLQIEDMESKTEVQLRLLQEDLEEKEWELQRERMEYQREKMEEKRALEYANEELRIARGCFVELDRRMEEQIRSAERLSFEQRAQLFGSHLIINRYLIWEEMDKAKKAGIGEESSTT
ncbi:hypothetical protein HAX54_010656 [Datura stramonium]|uniref:Uncharacterized protein n=1 Tax=Datura stramonium TaxID=4076 RepID=A0ABS8TGM0_DATST|nr:hypothetical protein [Datura stramonium]